MKRTFGVGWLLALLLAVGSAPLAAQGVTTGAVRGRVVDQRGVPIADARLQLVNTQTGFRISATTRVDGRFGLENVTPGGPFTLSAQAIGYRAVSQGGLIVALGQVVTINFTMEQAAVQLEALTVTAQANPLLSRARTGASSTVSDSFIQRIPTISRNFTDLMSTSPLVNGASVAGQNNRFNNIQIDGGVNNDLFGLGSTGTPGGQVGERPISLEAIKEFQILIAPFDVRQGGFTGGLVNAITKSGTNEFHGSLYGFGQNESFTRDSVDRGPLGFDVQTKFHEYQYGGTIGGPIIRNRLQFFASVDLKRRSSPFFGYLQGNDAIDKDAFGITSSTADSVIAWSKTNLVDPGSAGQVNRDSPDNNIFFKLSSQLNDRSQLEFTFNNSKASDGSLIRSSSFSGYRSGFELGNAGYSINNTTRTARLRYNVALSPKYTNELQVGYQRIRDLRLPGMNTPLIFVGATGSSGAVSIGAERFSQGNELRQDNYEITDNFTIGMGSHLITVGTHNEFFKFYNQFFAGSFGVWSFATAADLYAGTPNHYEIALPLRPNGPLAQFKVNQLGFYAEDIWTATPKLQLTYGVRVDAPLLPTKPEANADLAAIAFTHVDGTTDRAVTDDMSTAPLWSPRLGFNYDVKGDHSTFLRGGVGIFSGRPPYVWVSNAFANSGLTQALLSCNGTQIPAFKTDIASQPTACAGGGAPSPPKPSIVYFDHGFKFPQTLRAALGVDKQLPWGMVGTFDFLYTKAINQFYLNDINLKGEVGTAAGEGGRALYGTPGTPNGSGIASTIRPTRISSGYNDVIRNSNSSGDNSWQASFQLNKQFSNNLSFNVGYTRSKTKDKECTTSSIANSNMRFQVLQGTLADRDLTTSCFDVPNKLALTGIFNLPVGFRATLSYVGFSSTPFTYTTNNDVNGDGLSGNDPIYVPANANDISLKTPSDWATLDEYIKSDPCLESARGTLLQRNTCRGPWQSFINARVSKLIPTVHGQSFEVSLDIFNVLNLINSDWGVVRSTTGNENWPILNATGYDVANGRNQYSLMNMKNLNAVSSSSSRYRLLLSGKYIF